MLLIFYGCSIKEIPEERKPTIPEKTKPERRRRQINKGFLGTWDSRESSAIFKIGATNGKYTIEAWDSDDGEPFDISEVTWNERQLKIVVTMPSTNRRTQLDLTIIDQNSLQCLYSGERYGKTFWYRKVEDDD